MFLFFFLFYFYYIGIFEIIFSRHAFLNIEIVLLYLTKLSIGYIVAKFGSICNVCFYRLWLRLLRLWGLSRWLQWSLLRWLLSIRRLLFRLCAASAACQRERQAASTGGSPFLMVLKSRFRSLNHYYFIPAVVWLWHSVREFSYNTSHFSPIFRPDQYICPYIFSVWV